MTRSAQTALNPLAARLNEELDESGPEVLAMLSAYGRRLYFPKGILSQSAEAKEKAHQFNATIGIATQDSTLARRRLADGFQRPKPDRSGDNGQSRKRKPPECGLKHSGGF